MRPLLKLPTLLLTMLAIASAVRADPAAEVQRSLLERQQRGDEFNLRMQQYQSVPPASPAQQQELDRVHLQNLQRLRNLNAQQLRQFDASQQGAQPDSGAAHAPVLLQQQFERERQIELQQLRWEERRLLDPRRPLAPK